MGEDNMNPYSIEELLEATKQVVYSRMVEVTSDDERRLIIDCILKQVLLACNFATVVGVDSKESDGHLFINYYFTTDTNTNVVSHVYSICVDDNACSVLHEYTVN